jgi:hypothetical protein
VSGRQIFLVFYGGVAFASCESFMNTSHKAANDTNRDSGTRNLVAICPFFIVKDLQTSIMRWSAGQCTTVAPLSNNTRVDVNCPRREL